MTGVAVVFQIGNLKFMQVPKSEERESGEDKGLDDLSSSFDQSAEERSGAKAEESLMEALEYFRHQPVPVKKSRSLWPFKKASS